MSHKSMYYSEKSYVMLGYNDDNGQMSNFASILKYHLSTNWAVWKSFKNTKEWAMTDLNMLTGSRDIAFQS